MKIKSADFVKSAPKLADAPVGELPEIALVGRSNVGKSSFINALCNRKNLAKTSNTPGKTRLLNYYIINEQFYIVDMPGYGFARVSKSEQALWRQNFEKYLKEREQLQFVIQFIDARHEVQKNDIQMREWLDYNNIKTITVVTKSDLVKKSKLNQVINDVKNLIGEEIILFSGKTGYGKDAILELLSEVK
ncbi:MAG: ribosome biogenesis GTP-binding protein YihA/YsxC [Candidatus Gastranaerophilales bacterium]|nr:ribosome biogenesis GTP-binding protein YihA/YsxC [Candidatus Gastranaerophilales bacterium]